MLNIYTITAIPLGREQYPRCFGFYYFLPSAEQAVRENRGSMQECYYSYIVIEKIGKGIHAHATDIKWYRWVFPIELFENQEPHWEECERPTGEQFDGIVNFNGIG